MKYSNEISVLLPHLLYVSPSLSLSMFAEKLTIWNEKVTVLVQLRLKT